MVNVWSDRIQVNMRAAPLSMTTTFGRRLCWNCIGMLRVLRLKIHLRIIASINLYHYRHLRLELRTIASGIKTVHTVCKKTVIDNAMCFLTFYNVLKFTARKTRIYLEVEINK